MSSLTANRADKSADKGALEEYYYYYHHHHHHHHLFLFFFGRSILWGGFYSLLLTAVYLTIGTLQYLA